MGEAQRGSRSGGRRFGVRRSGFAVRRSGFAPTPGQGRRQGRADARTGPTPGPGRRPTSSHSPLGTHTRTLIYETPCAHKGGIKPLCAVPCCLIPSLVCDTGKERGSEPQGIRRSRGGRRIHRAARPMGSVRYTRDDPPRTNPPTLPPRRALGRDSRVRRPGQRACRAPRIPCRAHRASLG